MAARGTAGLTVIAVALLVATGIAYYFHARTRDARNEGADRLRGLLDGPNYGMS